LKPRREVRPMNRVVKSVFLLFVSVLLIVSLSSCAFLRASRSFFKTMDKILYRPDPGPYVPFTPITFDLEGIDQPKHAWTYHWPEDYDRTLEAMVSLQVDSHGNVYILGRNFYFYALNSSGERLWGKKNFFQRSFVLCDEGVIADSMSGLRLLDLKGQTKSYYPRGTSDFYLAPDGFIVGEVLTGLVSYDAKGKLRWHMPFDEDQYDYLHLEGYFFDTQSNGYYIFNASVPETPEMKKNMQWEHHTLIMSVSSDGKLRWKKVLSTKRQFLEEFLPTKESLVEDTFLLAFHQAEQEEPPEEMTQEWYESSWGRWYDAKGVKPKTIKAFNTDGEELWQVEETRLGLHDLDYAIDQENNFYFAYNEQDASTPYWELISGHLMKVSKEGKLLWSKAMEGQFETAPLLDKNKHIYIGLQTDDSNLFAFYPDGTEKWRMKVEVLNQYLHSLTFGPKRSLYFTSSLQSLLFCVRERK